MCWLSLALLLCHCLDVLCLLFAWYFDVSHCRAAGPIVFKGSCRVSDGQCCGVAWLTACVLAACCLACRTASVSRAALLFDALCASLSASLFAHGSCSSVCVQGRCVGMWSLPGSWPIARGCSLSAEARTASPTRPVLHSDDAACACGQQKRLCALMAATPQRARPAMACSHRAPRFAKLRATCNANNVRSTLA